MIGQNIPGKIHYGLGVIGYLFCSLQWVWAIALYLPQLLESGLVQYISSESELAPQLDQSEVASHQSPIAIVFAYIIMTVFVALAVYLLTRLPKAVYKTGEKVVTAGVKPTLRVASHHHALTKRKQIQLSDRAQAIGKLTLCIVPYVAGLMAVRFTNELPSNVIQAVASILALSALAMFSLQLLTTRWRIR